MGGEEPPTPTPAWPPAGSASSPPGGLLARDAAAGKGQCVQAVVSGCVSKSRPQELGGRLGTGRGPSGNGAASPASCLTSKVTPTAPALPIFSPEPQENHSHHLGNSL